MGQGAVAPDGMIVAPRRTDIVASTEPLMEHIRQAVELAKAQSGGLPKPPASAKPNASPQDSGAVMGPGESQRGRPQR